MNILALIVTYCMIILTFISYSREDYELSVIYALVSGLCLSAAFGG